MVLFILLTVCNIKSRKHFDITSVVYMKMRTPIPAQLKQSILRRQNHKCRICCVFLDVYDIDHIVPYRVQPVHRLNNLQALCPTCHARKTRREASDLAMYVKCEQTQSHRYCWSCKKVVSSYFGYQNGECMKCFSHSFEQQCKTI